MAQRTLKIPWRQKMKQEFYRDFMDIYWSDEFDNGCSDNVPFYREARETYDNDEFWEDYDMISRIIKIEFYKDIKNFVDLSSKYGDDLVVRGRNYEFPACSLMSVMSLVDLSDGVKIQFPECQLDNILKDFGKWMVNND